MSEVKKVISLTERSTKAMVKAAGDMAKVATELNTLSQTSVTLAEEIEYRQAELAGLDSQFASKEREKAAELRLKVIENEDGVLADLMKKRGLASISNVELTQLKRDLENALDNNEEAVNAAREAGYSAAASKFTAEVNQLKSDHRVEMAELNASSAAKDSRIEFLESQVAQLQGELKAERETRLKIAEADSRRQGVVVNAGKS
ncbi:hypothetical protein CKB20_14960 [Salmonella enterica]|uniref:hypothetical protein n=1 Tax=Enterobacter cloacae complex TaxID=354276 RepID=UPI00075E0C40|nr:MULTISPECIES: hypothetical protein [Enterobacter cloacae complex]EAS5284067.1 hypothetical protein [Salmonella enterica]EBH0935942.1 hypothetical protein [Salmonella enterica subsp. enterica serovar Eko]EBO2871985.1 hypothetical protein [Salmonella enterica subsp. enterica serovar Anatum]EBU3103175.1 hypothetical protein [Salmonella enterica subsp. enterica]ECC0436213.1 hypothetical protein [Salmonella enterica subsp. enterica serovar Typhimurium]ECU6950109.1 hypothetical protein [Salmonel